MESFPDRIKRLRKEKGVPLRVVAAYLDIDQAVLSKIENGKRGARRETVIKIAEYYDIDEKELLVAWLSDKMLYGIDDYNLALEAIKVAEKKISYKKLPPLSREKIIGIIREFLRKDGRVEKAWIFGSFARGDYGTESDVDLMVTYSEKATGTLLDYADIKYFLEKLIHREVDLVEENYVKPFALKNIENEKILIYGK